MRHTNQVASSFVADKGAFKGRYDDIHAARLLFLACDPQSHRFLDRDQMPKKLQKIPGSQCIGQESTMGTYEPS